MAVTPELSEYVNNSRQKGVSDDAIREELLKAGWNVEDINILMPQAVPNIVGTKLRPAEAVSPQQTVIIPKSRNFLLPVVIVLVIAVAGAAYYFLPQISGLLIPNSANRINNANSVTEQNKIDIANIYTELQNYLSLLSTSTLAFMNMKPIDRVIATSSVSSYAYTEALGYKFQTPWGKGTVSDRTTASLNLKQIFYSNGNKFIFSCSTTTPRDAFTDPNFYGSLTRQDLNRILAFLGSRADSTYEYENFLLSVTPEDVQNSTTTAGAEVLSKIIVLKPAFPSSEQPYRFSTSYVKGFQFGDYLTPHYVFVMIFPNDNSGNRCDLIAAAGISQKDMDIILSSFSPSNKNK